jgi:MSHA biogenesis protein MshJ
MANSEVTELILQKMRAWNKHQRLQAGLAGSVVVCFLLQLIFLSPVDSQITALKTQQINLQSDMRTTNSQIQAILADVEQSLANPNSPKSRTYKEQEQALDKALGQFYDELVTPAEMTDLLRELVNQDSQLTLVSMSALPVIDVLTETNIPADQLVGENRPKLYKRGIILTLKGDYFGVVNYLKKVEDLSKRLMWGELSYTVTMYPAALVKITVYTLTESEEWIGG